MHLAGKRLRRHSRRHQLQLQLPHHGGLVCDGQLCPLEFISARPIQSRIHFSRRHKLVDARGLRRRERLRMGEVSRERPQRHLRGAQLVLEQQQPVLRLLPQALDPPQLLIHPLGHMRAAPRRRELPLQPEHLRLELRARPWKRRRVRCNGLAAGLAGCALGRSPLSERGVHRAHGETTNRWWRCRALGRCPLRERGIHGTQGARRARRIATGTSHRRMPLWRE